MLTKGAIGNLINRYKAVLGKCMLINTFGSLAAAFFIMTAPVAASAVELETNDAQAPITGGDYTVTAGDVTLTGTGVTVFDGGTVTIGEGRTLTLIGANDDTTLNGTVGGRATDIGTITGAAGNLNIVASGDYSAGISYGTFDIDVNELSIESGNFGIYGAEAGDKTITANSVTIRSGGDAIHLQGANDSNISITANTIDIEGGVGVRNAASDGTSAVSLSGDTIRITAIGDESHVAAVDQIGTGPINITAREIDIAAIGGNTDAINVAEGTLTLSASESINVTGDIVSRKFEYEGGSFPDDPTNGTLALTSGDLRITDGTVTGFAGTFDQSGGRTFLTEENGFFAGDVNLRRGQILVGDVDVSEVGLTGDEAALALGSNVTLNDTQRLNVGATDAATAGGAAFARDGMLIVDGDTATPLLSGPGTLTMEDGSQVYIVDAKVGQTYDITDFADETSLSNATLRSSRLTDATLNPDGTVTVGLDARSSMLAGAIPASALYTMVSTGINDTDSPYGGIRFLSRAAEPEFMASDRDAVGMVNEASQAAATAGVQNTALRISDAAAQSVLHHMSIGHYDAWEPVQEGNVDFWATPMYGNLYTSGMGGQSGHSVRGQYGGLTLGVDAKVAEFCQGVMRAGISINGGGGKSDTKGTVTDVDNSYGFGGLNIYSAWQRERFNLIGVLGYGFGDHDVEMSLPSSMQMGTAKADLDTHAFTADLRAEYVIPTPYVDFLPHIGVRYTHLHTDGYDLKAGGRKINAVDSDDQDIVQFPVGLAMTKSCTWNDWTFRPFADVSYIPVAGDHKTKSKVRYSGIDASDSVNARIMDDDSWAGMVGLMTEYDKVTVGLHYSVQASSHETDQGAHLTFGWKF